MTAWGSNPNNLVPMVGRICSTWNGAKKGEESRSKAPHWGKYKSQAGTESWNQRHRFNWSYQSEPISTRKLKFDITSWQSDIEWERLSPFKYYTSLKATVVARPGGRMEAAWYRAEQRWKLRAPFPLLWRRRRLLMAVFRWVAAMT